MGTSVKFVINYYYVVSVLNNKKFRFPWVLFLRFRYYQLGVRVGRKGGTVGLQGMQ